MCTLKRFGIVPTLIVLLLLSACGQESVRPSNEKTGAPNNPDSTVLVALGHEVKDFDEWRVQHDSLSAVRDAYGISDVHIMQGDDEPNVAWTISSAPGLEAALAYLSDPDLERFMAAEGVIGEVYRAILDPGYTNSLNMEDFPYRLIVQHEVRNFDRWKSIFDGHVGSRELAGVYDLLVTHPVDDSSDVHMMFGILNPEETADYMSSELLRASMRLSGVIGEPRAFFLKVVE